MGFATWAFMPASMHFCTSSKNASAVMAMMGISLSGLSIFLMTFVASNPFITGIRISISTAL